MISLAVIHFISIVSTASFFWLSSLLVSGLFSLSALLAGYLAWLYHLRHTEAKAQLQVRNQQLEEIMRIGTQLRTSIPLPELLALGMRHICEILPVGSCALYLRDLETNTYVLAAGCRDGIVSTSATECPPLPLLPAVRIDESRFTAYLVPHMRKLSAHTYDVVPFFLGTSTPATVRDWNDDYDLLLPLYSRTGSVVGALLASNLDRKFISDVHLLRVLAIFIDQFGGAIEISTLLEEMQGLSTRDPLTGLANRRELYRRLDMELARANRANTSCALLLLDLDHFKEINDTYGHLVGDAVLRDFGQQLLSSNVRPYDLPARYAGDEFVMVLPGTSRSEAEALVERLMEAISAHHFPVPGVGASIGMAVYPQDANDREALITAADRSMYRVKATGRRRHPLLNSALDFSPQLINALHECGNALLSGNSIAEQLRTILATIAHLISADSYSISIYDSESDSFQMVVALGIISDVLPNWNLPRSFAEMMVKEYSNHSFQVNLHSVTALVTKPALRDRLPLFVALPLFFHQQLTALIGFHGKEDSLSLKESDLEIARLFGSYIILAVKQVNPSRVVFPTT